MGRCLGDLGGPGAPSALQALGIMPMTSRNIPRLVSYIPNTTCTELQDGACKLALRIPLGSSPRSKTEHGSCSPTTTPVVASSLQLDRGADSEWAGVSSKTVPLTPPRHTEAFWDLFQPSLEMQCRHCMPQLPKWHPLSNGWEPTAQVLISASIAAARQTFGPGRSPRGGTTGSGGEHMGTGLFRAQMDIGSGRLLLPESELEF